MKVTYGSGGHRGVTHLMAVGADDMEMTVADQTINRGVTMSAIAAAAGAILDMPKLATAGAGALVALLVVRHVSRKQTVAVTSAVPPTTKQI